MFSYPFLEISLLLLALVVIFACACLAAGSDENMEPQVTLRTGLREMSSCAAVKIRVKGLNSARIMWYFRLKEVEKYSAVFNAIFYKLKRWHQNMFSLIFCSRVIVDIGIQTEKKSSFKMYMLLTFLNTNKKKNENFWVDSLGIPEVIFSGYAQVALLTYC